jgi:hypothetical protein
MAKEIEKLLKETADALNKARDGAIIVPDMGASNAVVLPAHNVLSAARQCDHDVQQVRQLESQKRLLD